jgi:hypothetical protein
LTENIVARTTKFSSHYVVAVRCMDGIAVVPHLMSRKLALQRETIGKVNLVHACVVTRLVTKSSNVSAPNHVSSSEVFTMKQMNDIGIDGLADDISNKILKQPVGIIVTDIVVASLI